MSGAARGTLLALMLLLCGFSAWPRLIDAVLRAPTWRGGLDDVADWPVRLIPVSDPSDLATLAARCRDRGARVGIVRGLVDDGPEGVIVPTTLPDGRTTEGVAWMRRLGGAEQFALGLSWPETRANDARAISSVVFRLVGPSAWLEAAGEGSRGPWMPIAVPASLGDPAPLPIEGTVDQVCDDGLPVLMGPRWADANLIVYDGARPPAMDPTEDPDNHVKRARTSTRDHRDRTIPALRLQGAAVAALSGHPGPMTLDTAVAWWAARGFGGGWLANSWTSALLLGSICLGLSWLRRFFGLLVGAIPATLGVLVGWWGVTSIASSWLLLPLLIPTVWVLSTTRPKGASQPVAEVFIGRLDVFVVFTGRDRTFVGQLVEALESQSSKLLDEPLRVFWDARLPLGARWQPWLRAACERCRVGIVVVSEGPASPYLQDEIARLVERARRDDVLLLPLYRDGGSLASPPYGLLPFQGHVVESVDESAARVLASLPRGVTTPIR
ncbi:MAG: TIR domain-containing protein, partial [Myxococcota bacterium]